MPEAADSLEVTSPDIKLLANIVSRYDVSRLIRELEDAEELYNQRALAKGFKSTMSIPRYTELLQETASELSLNLSNKRDRASLVKYLEDIRDNAPVMHFHFATEISEKPLFQLVSWLRSEIDKDVLLEIRLQPAIISGSIVRTTNKYFDYSAQAGASATRDLVKGKLRSLLESI